MPSPNQHTFVIPPDVWTEIEKRAQPHRGGRDGIGGANAALATIVRRYVALLAESRSRNRAAFSPTELAFLRDELTDAPTGETLETALMVYADEHPDAAPAGVDAGVLYERVRALSPTDKIGLLDSIERARVAESHGKRIIATPRGRG